jgi:hypothetical protein
MEYIAFIALRRTDTPWMFDRQGRPYLVADGLNDQSGIRAASWGDAAEYDREIYAVVPYLDGDNPAEIALDTFGWRAPAATVIAGPWASDDEDGMRQAAGLILASYMQGYRQVKGILVWAAGAAGSYDDNSVPVALSILERAVLDNDPDVRRLAVYGAGEIGMAALPVLEQAMRDADPSVRWLAVQKAGEIGTPAVLPILERAMWDDAPGVRLQAVYAAG